MAIALEYYESMPEDELIQDEFFIESITRPSTQTEDFWKEFLERYPYRRETLDAAREVIITLKFNTDKADPTAKDRIWGRVKELSVNEAPVVSMKRWHTWKVAAAAIVGIILVSAAWLMLQRSGEETFATNYAEVKQFILPDQSVVTLNSNSNIKFRKDWAKGEPREVWLEGEAFFDVKHLNRNSRNVLPSERFIVHVGKMNVEVLGTSFNVNDRNSITEVLLQTGKVRIGFDDPATEMIVMEPGELAKIDQGSKSVTREKTDTTAKLLWKQRKLLLNNTSVKELFDRLENEFGYKAEIENKAILEKQLSGTSLISLEDEEALFRSLEVILNVIITRNGNTLHVKNK